MNSAHEYVVTRKHHEAFGMIVQAFARHEQLMTMTAAWLLDAQLWPIAVVMAGLGYAGKRDAIVSIIKHVEPADERTDAISGFLNKLDKFSKLRNNIAHSTWTEGKRPDSIKPMTVIVRHGSGRFIGANQNEPDYTVKELFEAANQLNILYNSFAQFVQQSGIGAAVQAKTNP